MPADLLLGAIADDYTGATDLAGMIAAEGVRVVQVLGRQPDSLLEQLADSYQAIVVSLKSRSIPAVAAQSMSVDVARQLRLVGARQIYFKYCSTFDSTSEGNIGPVTDALLDELGESFAVAVPALPVNGRTQYLGHLFVNGVLMSQSPLRHHPVNPMTDANLVRHLQAQTTRKVGLVPLADVRRGPGAVRRRIAVLRAEGVQIALLDAVGEEDLDVIARAVVDHGLVTASSGLGMKLPVVWRDRGWLRPSAHVRLGAADDARVLILAGSCSDATLEQIRVFEQSGRPSLRMDVRPLLSGEAAGEVDRLEAEMVRALNHSPAVLIASSMPATERAAMLAKAEARGIAAEAARFHIEQATAELARRAVTHGVTKLVVAGGETSGAVVEALNVTALEVGSMVDPGVPRCRTIGARPLDLLLKSGNFGATDFFLKGVRALRAEEPQ